MRLAGAGFGAGLYRNLVRSNAFPCNGYTGYKPFTPNELCDYLQALATECENVENGLKIRRGQPRGGSTPPPGTKV